MDEFRPQRKHYYRRKVLGEQEDKEMSLKTVDNLTDLVGETPLLRPHKIEALAGLKDDTKLLLKLEYFNPLSSIKDRIALAMVEDAEERGLLNKDSVIIEPTSGNTGVGLAFVAAAKGYKILITMPDSMSLKSMFLTFNARRRSSKS